jgi:acyl-CoA thioesterase I
MGKPSRHRALSYPLAVAMMAAACEAGSSPSGPSAVAADGPARRIVVLGDSLAVSPSRAQGFPSVLQARLEARELRWTVRNESVSGDTTTGGLRRLDAALADSPDILIVALGANDGLRGVDVTVITRNLAEIVERAQARGVTVLLCGMETPPINGWNYTVAFHHIFPGLARKYAVPLVPFLLAGVALNPEMNRDDLIHPNAAGARQIADTIWPFLEPLVSARTAGG